MSKQAGASLAETVRDATEALSHQRIDHRVTEELAQLRNDREAWLAYLEEAESTSVTDGIG